MRRRLLSLFAAVCFACAVFVIILWCRSLGPGESIQWRSTRWIGHDQRLSRTIALLTQGGQITLALQTEDRRIVFRSRVTRDERDPGRTTFRWDVNTYMPPPIREPTLLNRLGFSKHAERESRSLGSSRTANVSLYRYELPFWFLTLILLLPPGYWLWRRGRSAAARVSPPPPPLPPNPGVIT